MPKITINLWFDNQAEDAAQFYAGIFPNSTIGGVAYYPDEGQEITSKAGGDTMVVPFTLNGQAFLGLNGGKAKFMFNEAISFVVNTETQNETDHYWNALTADGGQESQCGWLKDKYGVSWQIVPSILGQLVGNPNPDIAKRCMAAMLTMKKIDIAQLQAAADGE